MGGWVGGFARRDYGDFRDLLVPEVFRTLVFLRTFVDILAIIRGRRDLSVSGGKNEFR